MSRPTAITTAPPASPQVHPAPTHVPPGAAVPRHLVKYPSPSAFRDVLRRRVDDYFRTSRRPRTGGVRMAIKTALVLGWFAATFVGLLVFASSGWQVAALTLSAGLALAAIGFNIQHDGSHGAYARSPRVNRLMARALDAIGGSSYIWHWQHNVIHHTFTNIEGVDEDLNVGVFGRFAPDQPRRWFHRYQHLYMWFLYGLIPFKWWFWDDVLSVVHARVGRQPIPPPPRREIAAFVASKAVFFGWALGLPLLFHPWPIVLGVFCSAAFVTGVTLGTVFQLAHCLEEASFPSVRGGSTRVERPFYESQLATTVDFCPTNPLVTWFVGGLNFQIEHHLFPKVCHLHYPALAPIVEKTCREFGVPYNVHRSLWGALASHVRWLRRLGRGEETAPSPA